MSHDQKSRNLVWYNRADSSSVSNYNFQIHEFNNIGVTYLCHMTGNRKFLTLQPLTFVWYNSIKFQIHKFDNEGAITNQSFDFSLHLRVT